MEVIGLKMVSLREPPVRFGRRRLIATLAQKAKAKAGRDSVAAIKKEPNFARNAAKNWIIIMNVQREFT